MWDFAHLLDLPGASFVTLGAQKSQGVENRHNVALAFKKHERPSASVGTPGPRIDMILPVARTHDFLRAK